MTTLEKTGVQNNSNIDMEMKNIKKMHFKYYNNINGDYYDFNFV